MLATSVPGLFCIAAGASAVGGALGMASGIFIVPLLTIVAGVDVHLAIGASIVSVIACSCGSAGPLLKERLTNVRLAIVLETATTLGAASGVLVSGAVPVSVLYAIFATVLLIAAWQMLTPRRVAAIPSGGASATSWARRLDAVYPDRNLGGDVAYRVDRLSMGLGLMYGAGLLSALLGIGSGVLKIPAMDTALRLPIKVSSATSNFMIGVTAAASAGGYFMRGAIVPEIAGPVALGFSCRRNSGSAAAGVRHAWQASPDLRRCSACPGSPDGARGGWRSRRALSMTILTSGAPDRLNNRLARLLVLGTWMSCGLIMIGMASPALGASPRFASADFVSTGIVLLIALPTMRVATMAVWFLFNDDRDFALIAALVLAIIVASTLLGAGVA